MPPADSAALADPAATPPAEAPPAYDSALALIGRTPMLELHGFDAGPCRLFVKLESANPGGSIKDRIALTMIEAAERDGRLKPGGVIVEATAGNTGLGLAQVGILKGYTLILVVPDKMAREKIQHLRGLGVDVRITRSRCRQGACGLLSGHGRPPGPPTSPTPIFINQFENPANPQGARDLHRPGDPGTRWIGDIDAVIVRRRLRRHADRPRPVLQAKVSAEDPA